jgi:hypothetical protein
MVPLRAEVGVGVGAIGPYARGPKRAGVRSALHVRAVAPNVVQRHHPYSPKLVEGEFCELRLLEILRSLHPEIGT